MGKVTVKEGQSIFDICIQETGGISGVFDIAKDNAMDIDTPLFTGQLLDVKTEKENEVIWSSFEVKGITPTTSKAVEPSVGPPVASVTLKAYSDVGLTNLVTSGNYGSKVYLKAEYQVISPTEITFSIDGTKDKVVTQTGAGFDVYEWTIDSVGAVEITARATNGTGATATTSIFEFTASLVVNRWLSLDGVNDYGVSGLPKINSATAWSISFRFKLDSTSGRTPLYSLAAKNQSGRPTQGMYYEANKFTFLSVNNYTFAQSLSWTGDTDEHVFTLRYDSSIAGVEIFIDGISIGTKGGAAYTAGFWSLVIGRAYVFQNYGNVKLTDLRMYNHYLTTGEVATIQGLGVGIGSEILWYSFNEDVGETDYCIDIINGYQLALYNVTSPNGIISYP